MLEVTKMSNTKQNKHHPAKDEPVNPTATGQAIDHKPELVNPKQDDIKAIRGKAYEALLAKDGAFSSMYALNPMITGNVVNALLDFFIVNPEEANPLEILQKEPSKTIWQSFFDSYNGTTTKSLTNTANASQSFRNMLACFPAKAKQVMIALDTCGLPNNWIIPKNSKKQSLSEADIKEVDALLQKTGILNPSMDIASRYKVFKALGGKLTSRKEAKQ